MADELKRFGRYFLLDHIAQGGMAEIYRARLASPDGAGRIIVIKRIQPGYGKNAEFLQMFRSEIKVTMGFSHPNIVQLFDFGEEEGQPFIAMEMVDGKNLRQFTSRFNEQKKSLPVELAAYIVEQAASGLHYAHSFTEKISGVALNIVHRDVSPQNILISYEGTVKVIDFGIAKATTNLEATRAGVIKGKPSYLSPEQISGEVLDARSDIFALGAVFWELLTGRKLFAGENDLAVLKLIESAHTSVKPPSSLNPMVPKELDQIVLRTLARSREKRYQTADELQRALHRFIYGFCPDFNPSDMAYYAKDLFKNEIVEDRKRIQKLSAQTDALLAASTPLPRAIKIAEPQPIPPAPDLSLTAVSQRNNPTPTQIRDAKSVRRSQLAVVELDTTPEERLRAEPATFMTHQSASRPGNAGGYAARPQFSTGVRSGTGSYSRLSRPAPRARTKIYVLYGTGCVLLTAIFGPSIGVSIPYLSDFFTQLVNLPEASVRLESAIPISPVKITLNGQEVGTSLPTTLTHLPIGTRFQIQISGPSMELFQQELSLKEGEKRTFQVSARPPPKSNQAPPLDPNTVTLTLDIQPPGGDPTVKVNGLGIDPAALKAYVLPDRPISLSVDRPGYKPFHSDFVLTSAQLSHGKDYTLRVALEPVRFGFLTIHTVPSASASIQTRNFQWKAKTPIETEKIPVGIYTIKLTNDVLGMEKDVSVSVEEGKSVNLDVRLEIKN